MDDTAVAKLVNDLYDRFSKRVDELQAYITKLADKTYDRTDAVFKEVLAVRQEQSVHAGAHERINDELEDHEERLKKQESHIMSAH